MKICSNCQRQFPDEYVFCLKDGTMLVAAVTPDIPIPAVTTSLRFCGNCATPLLAEFAFCQKCGTPKSKFETGSLTEGGGQTGDTSDLLEKSDFLSRLLQDKKKLTIMGTVAGVIVVLFIVIVGVKSGSSSTNANSANTSNSANRSTSSTNTNSASSSSSASNSDYSNRSTSEFDSSVIGRTGLLMMDVNMRSAPNKDSLSLGTHYQDAVVEILDATSFDTPTGYSTWYKVRVTRYGCSSANRSSCGSNRQIGDDFGWLQAENEGWMNAKFIQIN